MADKKGIMQIYGQTGLHRFGGQVYEEQLRQLSGTRAVKVYAEMRDNDAAIGAFLFLIEMLIRTVPWTVKPASEDKADKDNAQFVDECKNDMSHTWEDLMSDILSMLVFGWAYFEIVYKRRGGPGKDPTKRSLYTDGRIGWRKIEIRSQESLDDWEFQDDGGISGMYQRPAPTYERIYIPIEKALLFRTKSAKNSPEGRSFLRNSYRSWFFKKRLEEIEAIGIERDLVGLPVMQVPPQVMMDDAPAALVTLRGNLEKMISEIRRDEREGMLIPAEEITDDGKIMKTGYKFGLVSTGGQRQIDTDKVIRRYESRILMTVLAQFLLLGQDKVGSFSLASSSTDVFAVAISAILDNIAAVFNRYAIPRLFEANNINAEQLPELVPGDLEKQDLEKFAVGLEKLIKVGAIRPGIALERHVRGLYELPELDEDDLYEQEAAVQPTRKPTDDEGDDKSGSKPKPKPEPQETDDGDQ